MFIRLDNFRRLALPRGSIHKAFRLVHTREAHLEAKFRLSTRFARRSLRQENFLRSIAICNKNQKHFHIKFLQTSRSISASVWVPDSLLSMHSFLRQEGVWLWVAREFGQLTLKTKRHFGLPKTVNRLWPVLKTVQLTAAIDLDIHPMYLQRRPNNFLSSRSSASPMSIKSSNLKSQSIPQYPLCLQSESPQFSPWDCLVPSGLHRAEIWCLVLRS